MRLLPSAAAAAALLMTGSGLLADDWSYDSQPDSATAQKSAKAVSPHAQSEVTLALEVAALEEARAAVGSLAAGGTADGDVVLTALGDAARRFPIPLGAFGELIDGCQADVRGTTYGTFGELEQYCRCVAGSIGRLSLGVFGCKDVSEAAPLADSLGVALQLTNIVRDIKEDLGNGRVYLPAADLEKFGCTLRPAGPDGDETVEGDLAAVITFEGERARDWYSTGMALMPLLDRRSAASAGAMAGIYRRLLEHICADPQEVMRRRVSLPASQKAMVAAGALAGMARRTGTRGAGSRGHRNGQRHPADVPGGQS